ncbi:MAG: A/G-specific adenine glycosylase [bacterium JZ-2024 1]
MSETMLQQTPVQTVLRYFPRFLERFPSPKFLAKASLDEVLKQWEGMGYYARARNLHRAAQILWNAFEKSPFKDFGRFVRHWLKQEEKIFSLPGVGKNIGAMILSLCFKKSYPVLDANALRVYSRWFALKEEYLSRDLLKKVEPIARFFVQKHPGLCNQAIIELGETICLPRKPRCEICPVSPFCDAFQTGKMSIFPLRKARKDVPFFSVVAAVIQKNGRILITRRKDEGLLGGLWEFPGGKVEKGESDEEALKRELKEELNLNVHVGKFLMKISHRYTHMKVLLKVYEAEILSGDLKKIGVSDYRWVRPEEMQRYAFPAADKKILSYLQNLQKTAEFSSP